MKLFRVRPAPCSQQHGIGFKFKCLICLRISESNHCFFWCMVHRLHLRVHLENNPFFLQRFFHTCGNVAVFTGYQFGIALQYRYLRAERGVHRRKFQPDITTADNDEMTWKSGQFHDWSTGIYKRIIHNSFNRRNHSFRTCIDYDLFGCQYYLFRSGTNSNGICRKKRAHTCINRHIRMIR